MFKPIKARLALLVGLSLGAVSCDACDDDDDFPADTVQTRASSAGNFESYNTFAFPNPGDLMQGGDVIPPRVIANLAIVNDQMRQDLETLGFTEVEPDENPDLMAVSLASSNSQDAIIWECVPGGWYGGWYWAWDPCGAYSPEYVEYTEGVFWVGLVDPKIEEVVFAGLAYGYGDGSGNDLDDRIESAMHRIFEVYPNPPIDRD